MMERPQSGLQTLDNIAAAADLLSSLERTGSECSVQELTGHCFLFLLRGKVQPGCICSSVCRHRESFSLNRIHRGPPDEWSRAAFHWKKEGKNTRWTEARRAARCRGTRSSSESH